MVMVKSGRIQEIRKAAFARLLEAKGIAYPLPEPVEPVVEEVEVVEEEEEEEEEAEPEAVVEVVKPKRAYRRRDMKAE